MRARPPYTVVIADAKPLRIGVVRQVLDQRYESPCEVVGGLDALRARLQEQDASPVDLVVLADGLPGLRKRNINECLGGMFDLLGMDGCVVVVTEGAGSEKLDRARVYVLQGNGGIIGADDLVRALDGILRLPESPPELILPPEPNRMLRELVRGLSEDGAYEKDKAILGRLIRKVRHCPQVRIERPSQGYSGSKVLCVYPQPEPSEAFVLKITDRSKLWRVENEVKHWQAIKAALTDGPLVSHVAPIMQPLEPERQDQQIVTAGGFYATAYTLLGGAAGAFLTFRDAYLLGAVAERDRLKQTRYEGDAGRLAEAVVQELLWLLNDRWHQFAKADTAGKPLWIGGEAEEKSVMTPPPYQLTAGQKSWLLGALEQVNELGERVLPGSWAANRGEVAKWIEEGAPPGSVALYRRPTAVSAVHGDLNGNNIFIWLRERQIVLIDFTDYQEKGHALQDFASLETHTKYSLMDNEADSPLPAFDHTYSQLEVWCKAEDHLASDEWESAWLPVAGVTAGTLRALRLIQQVRRQAREVHARAFPGPAPRPSAFLPEYRAGLLHRTLRAIGFDNLSPFKRILAVYSAARLIEKLSQPAT